MINGFCAWVKAEELFRAKDGRGPMTASERQLLEENDPASSHLKMGSSRGMLLLHGKEDTTIPIESQRHYMKVMSQHNISPDLQFVEYSNVNHHITIGMLEKSKEWIDKYLSQ